MQTERLPATPRPIAFRDALHDHLDALCARDVARFTATLAPDVVTIDGRGGERRGSAVADAHARWFASAAWTFEYAERFVREFGGGGVAVVDVTYRDAPGVPAVRFVLSLVFERDATGAWRLLYDQNTTLPEAE